MCVACMHVYCWLCSGPLCVSIFVSAGMRLTVSGYVPLCGCIWVPGHCPKGLLGKAPLGQGTAASVLTLPDLQGWCG